MFSQVLFLAGNLGNLKNCVPSMPPFNLSLIYMGKKLKKMGQNFDDYSDFQQKSRGV
jgi:hypothetical protein